jgi:RNA polymerase sigma-32 factor
MARLFTTMPRKQKAKTDNSKAPSRRTKPVRAIEVDYRPLSEEPESLMADSDESGEQERDLDAEIAENPELGSEIGGLPQVRSPDAFPEPVEEAGDQIVARNDLLRRYIEDISRFPLLAPEEEFALACRLKEHGDLDAAKRLVSANLRLVVKIAMEYRSAYQNVMDLIQEGNVGLMKAVSKFDPTKGAKLSYYASWWIRSYILKYILDNFRLVRVGTTQAQKKLFFHLMREKERLEAQGLHAGPKLLADRLDVRERDVVEMEQRLSGRGAEMSLNAPVGPSGGEEDSRTTHIDVVVDPNAAPDELIAESELKEILRTRLDDFAKTLKEKELAVYRERLAAEEPKTLQEVADLFGLTRERARQIEARVIEKLRDYYKKFIR